MVRDFRRILNLTIIWENQAHQSCPNTSTQFFLLLDKVTGQGDRTATKEELKSMCYLLKRVIVKVIWNVQNSTSSKKSFETIKYFQLCRTKWAKMADF